MIRNTITTIGMISFILSIIALLSTIIIFTVSSLNTLPDRLLVIVFILSTVSMYLMTEEDVILEKEDKEKQ